MSILVSITKAPASVSAADTSKTFTEKGGSLGRGVDNTWVLDDPERFLSSCHCQISNENGQFYITDLSTNGTFFNGAINPMGKGTRLELHDGNNFVLGDYEFSVSVNDTSQAANADPFAVNSLSNGQPLEDDLFSSSASASPFGGGHVPSSGSLFSTDAEETDPLAALDKARGGSLGFAQEATTNTFSVANDPFQALSGSDPFGEPTHSDQAELLNEQVTWPNSVPEQSTFGGIPDDWNEDLTSKPARVVESKVPAMQPSIPLTPESDAYIQPGVSPSEKAQSAGQFKPGQALAMLAQQQENEKIQSELKILKQKISAQKHSVQTVVSVDTMLIEAMGLHNKNLVDEEITQINKVVGEMVREMVGGLMQVLGSRSAIKNEFRMNVTTIQPVENNPLQFSANVDDAMENMFIKEGNAYQKPVEAVKESFEGIAEHQVAILAGIRAAFKGVIERFDPIVLEQRFSKQKKSSIIPGSQKAKNWESYLDYYNDLAGDIDHSFQYLFGDEFVKAYEDQLQKLAIAKKIQKSKTD